MSATRPEESDKRDKENAPTHLAIKPITVMMSIDLCP